MDIVMGWVGIGLMFVISTVGWLTTYIRNNKSQAINFGILQGKVELLETTVNNQQANITKLTTRIDKLIDHVNF